MIHSCAYVKPAGLEEALDALQEVGAWPLAGGTDLIVDMRNGVKRARLVVDIKGIEDLKVFSCGEDGGITVGAAVPLTLLIESGVVRRQCPVLAEAAFTIATYQLRNRATMMGNICNASPAADMAPPLYILGAQVVVATRSGERKVGMKDFITGVKKNSLGKGELAARVEIPPVSKTAKTAFLKKQRIRGHDLATVNMAGLADREAGRLTLCIGACSVTPVVLEGTDRLFRDEKKPEKLIERVSEIALRSISPIDDVRSSAEYRQDMVRVYIKRLLSRICS